jgi:hypothetical protein
MLVARHALARLLQKAHHAHFLQAFA